jgi:hypothetical protein
MKEKAARKGYKLSDLVLDWRTDHTLHLNIHLKSATKAVISPVNISGRYIS